MNTTNQGRDRLRQHKGYRIWVSASSGHCRIYKGREMAGAAPDFEQAKTLIGVLVAAAKRIKESECQP